MNDQTEIFYPRDHFKVGDSPVKIKYVGETFERKFYGLAESPRGELFALWKWLIENQSICEASSLKKTGHLQDFSVRDGCEAPTTISVFWNGEGYCLGVRGEVIILPKTLETSE